MPWTICDWPPGRLKVIAMALVRAWLRSSEAFEEASSSRKEKVVDRPSSPSIDTRLSVSLIGVVIETSRGMRSVSGEVRGK